jgi:hypothetical protein
MLVSKEVSVRYPRHMVQQAGYQRNSVLSTSDTCLWKHGTISNLRLSSSYELTLISPVLSPCCDTIIQINDIPTANSTTVQYRHFVTSEFIRLQY